MADTSNYSIEECLVRSVCVPERELRGHTMNTGITAFKPVEK